MSAMLIVDCGTTNLRVTLTDEAGRVLATAGEPGGVRRTAIDGHDGALRASLRACMGRVLGERGLTHADVARCVAYGMITSDMGLMEIPHLCAPASAQALRAGMRSRTFEDIAPFPIEFIPGVRNAAGAVTPQNYEAMDMMRGEETEAVGLYALLGEPGACVLVLPGSHNKFVRMGEGGEIRGCMTSISGELLDALTHHTLLADAVERGFLAYGEYDEAMAREGARSCMRSGLGRAAFSGRILRVLGGCSAAQVRSYLLGVVLAEDARAMRAFAGDAGRVLVAGKPLMARAIADVLGELGMPGAQAVAPQLSARMGTAGALAIALGGQAR